MNSNKIPRYIEGLLNGSVECINNLFEEDAFALATGYFRKHIPDGSNTIRMHYLLHLKNILGISSAGRRDKLMQSLAMQYRGAAPDRHYNGTVYTKTFSGMVEEHGLFPLYYNIFKPISFDNAFNENLIQRLIEAGYLNLAKKYAEQQIKGNYQEVYNIPYLGLLKRIYTVQGDEEGLTGVLAQLLPHTFHFDDYLFLSNRMPEGEEKKKWRTKLVTKAKNASGNYNPKAAAFYFALLGHEGSYRKMIGSVEAYTPWHLIVQYFEPMALADKAGLLNAIVSKWDETGWGRSFEQQKEDAACFPRLLALMLKQYSASLLKTAIRQVEKGSYYFRANSFLTYLKKELPAGE